MVVRWELKLIRVKTSRRFQRCVETVGRRIDRSQDLSRNYLL